MRIESHRLFIKESIVLHSRYAHQVSSGGLPLNYDFEIFCSYARIDNDGEWVEKFVSELAKNIHKLTGFPSQIFIDRESLLTANIWESKIQSALEKSRLMIAIISPSYVCSEWCEREWKMFVSRENEFRKKNILDKEQGLIFPVLFLPLDRGRFNSRQKCLSSDIKTRQWLDASSQLEGNPIRPDQVRHLAEQIIDTIAALEQRKRMSISAATDSGATIDDGITGLEWSGTLSAKEMSFDEARRYVSNLETGGKRGWRLPTKPELESILDHSAMVDDPKASPFPLREPFNSQRFGYLHSGTLIGTGNFIMNTRNGHIFNGKGYDCYVRAVRDVV